MVDSLENDNGDGNSATNANGGGIIVESMATTLSTSSLINNTAGILGGGIYVGGRKRDLL